MIKLNANRFLNNSELRELHQLWENKELTQYELADKFGITRHLVRKLLKWELK